MSARSLLLLALACLVLACGGPSPPPPGRSGPVVPGSGADDGSTLACGTGEVPVFEDGAQVGEVCPGDVQGAGLTIVDLSDGWAPRMFAEGDSYRAQYVRLANRPPPTTGAEGDLDRFLAVYGVMPTPRVVAMALLSSARHECHDRVGGAGSLQEVQAHLACDGLLAEQNASGSVDLATKQALHAFQRRHFLLPTGVLDEATRDRLEDDSEQRDHRVLLRVLRERVVDATGLIEDGSAAGEPETVAGEPLDLPPPGGHGDLPALPGAAPDRIARATEAAAEALGWTAPEGAAAFFRTRSPEDMEDLRVAVRLPPPPDYHRDQMELRLEIDRGDVWYSPPVDESGEEREQPVERPPVLVVYALDGERRIPLVRWNTTIGGWRREEGPEGEVGLRYKESPVGERTVRHVVVAPAWLPPETTPDDELMRRGPDGRWVANRALMERGWASAFGLVMFKHERQTDEGLVDEGIRTHGTAQLQSIFDGYSHGCHRLASHLATRLAGFVLAHRSHRRVGLAQVAFQRRLEHDGQADRVTIENRGYVYELDPPLTVDVLRGRIRGELREPPEELVDTPSAR